MRQETIKEVKRGGVVVTTDVPYDVYEESDPADPLMRERATAMARVRATNEARVGGGTGLKRLRELVLRHGLKLAQTDQDTGQEVCMLSIQAKRDELLSYCEDQGLV